MLGSKKQKGFVALVTAVFISASLLIVVTTLSLSGFYSRYNVLDSEFKEQSLALADGCADIALVNIAINSAYLGNATSTIGGSECYVGSVSMSGSNKIFRTRGIYKNTYTNLEVTVNSSTLAVVSWKEIPIF